MAFFNAVKSFIVRWKWSCMLGLIVLLLLITFGVIYGEASKKQQRVCIVGAGVSGLVATKYFNEYPDEFETIVFEKSSDIGGQWLYTDSTTFDQHGLPVHSSIYQSLSTNAIKEMMNLPDFPILGRNPNESNYITHEEVLEYLSNYTDYYNLRSNIQFNTNVEKINPLPDMRWSIVATNFDTNTTNEILCDAVVVCNGHDVKGYVPKIPGIKSFTGRVMHSHVYRKPDSFANETVVVLGASYSGIDISVDTSSVAKQVYLSHRHDKLPDVFPSNVEQVPGVVSAKGRNLILKNCTKIPADTLIYCTGYFYDFPFLDESSGIVVDGGKYIRSIYKHFINIERPTMAIINMVQPGLHFQVPPRQVKYFRAMLRGELKLPSREQMLIESELPEGVPKSKAHYFDYNDFFPYLDELSLALGEDTVPWWFGPAIDLLDVVYVKDPVHFKDTMLIIHENNRTLELV